MKINEHEALLTSRVLLVPYSDHHVPTYHEWMKSEEIQKATASEPLTLEEEYSMQLSWRLDHDKLTFIICYAPSSTATSSSLSSGASTSITSITPQLEDAPERMIGDINLFLSEDEDSDSDQSPNQENSTNPYHLLPIIGEIEIMLAHTPSRGLGLASESLLTFLTYITLSLPSILEEYRQGSDKSERYLRYLRVKIDKENVKSIRLFEKVGFSKISEEPNYFGEVEMRTGVVGGRIVDVEERIGVEGVGRRIEYGV